MRNFLLFLLALSTLSGCAAFWDARQIQWDEKSLGSDYERYKWDDDYLATVGKARAAALGLDGKPEAATAYAEILESLLACNERNASTIPCRATPSYPSHQDESPLAQRRRLRNRPLPIAEMVADADRALASAIAKHPDQAAALDLWRGRLWDDAHSYDATVDANPAKARDAWQRSFAGAPGVEAFVGLENALHPDGKAESCEGECRSTCDLVRPLITSPPDAVTFLYWCRGVTEKDDGSTAFAEWVSPGEAALYQREIADRREAAADEERARESADATAASFRHRFRNR
jgi:hypothetical protein